MQRLPRQKPQCFNATTKSCSNGTTRFTSIPNIMNPRNMARAALSRHSERFATHSECILFKWLTGPTGVMLRVRSTWVRNDMEFWRFVARSSTTLISRLVSFSALSNDLRFTADLGTLRTLTAKELALVNDILRPFQHDEIALTKSFRGENRYLYKILEQLRQKNSHALFTIVIKPHATNNHTYANFQKYIRFAELPPQQYALAMKQHQEETEGISKIGIPFLCNPVGEILCTIGDLQGYTSYIEKGHNVEGLRRLALLKVLMRKERVSLNQVQPFLDAHASDLGNPYTGTAMTWDPKKGSILFDDTSGKKPVELFL